MVDRCTNRNNPRWKSYGGRGIKICARWRKFDNFLKDMGERPAGRTLERIDNDGNYEPGNCKWATQKEQANNTRQNYLLTYSGKTLNLGQWARLIGVRHGTLRARIRRGWSLGRAMSPILDGRGSYQRAPK